MVAHKNLPLSIRTAQSQDAGAITRLYLELTADPKTHVLPEHLATLASDPRTRVLVAETEGEVLGTVLINFCADPMYAGQAFAVLENLVVDDAARGRGLGKALLAEAERLCLAADCSKILLTSSAARTEAHRFFEACGFSGGTKRGFVKYRRHFAAQTPAHA